jgi:hypothetical protein
MARDTNRIAAQQGHAKQVSQAAAFLKKSGWAPPAQKTFVTLGYGRWRHHAHAPE